jgi:AcrR family transcriptional regulator
MAGGQPNVISCGIARRRGGTQPPLSRDDIVRAALPVLERDGVAGFTVRSVADALGISSPAVYHYFSGREELLDRLCERVAAEVDLSVGSEVAWDDAVVTIVLNMDRAFARFPGVAARVLQTHRPSPAAEHLTLVVHERIVRGGHPPERAEELGAALHCLFGGWLLGAHRRSGGPTRSNAAQLESWTRWMLQGFAA